MGLKKLWLAMAFALLLGGCGSQETFETVSDVQDAPVAAQAAKIQVQLPPEAAAPAVQSDAGRLYLCGDYEIALQTMESGDLDATVRSLCGYGREDVTVLETEQEGIRRYSFVWATLGEQGQQVGRAAILDDGTHHYTLSVLCNADTAGEHSLAWQEMFSSFRIAP